MNFEAVSSLKSWSRPLHFCVGGSEESFLIHYHQALSDESDALTNGIYLSVKWETALLVNHTDCFTAVMISRLSKMSVFK